MVVVAETTTGKVLETPDARRPGIGAVTDTVKLRFGGTSILISHPTLAEVADHPNPLPTHAPLRGPSLDLLRPEEKAVEVGIDLVTAVADPTADQCPPIDGIVESQGDAVRTTVTELDPIPAVIRHAHVLPEETETDGGLSLVACPHLLGMTGAGDALLMEDHLLGHPRDCEEQTSEARKESGGVL